MAAANIATDIATDMAKDVASTIIGAVIQQIKDVVELDQSLQLLNTDFGYMNSTLLFIEEQFQEQQRGLPVPVELCLTRMGDHLRAGQLLTNRANQQRIRCFGCCLLCNRNLFSQITGWKTRFEQLFQELERVFSITASTQQIVSAARPQAEVLLQDVPEDIVGSSIESAQVKLQSWLTEPAHSQARVIGIYGMGGVGKTSLLKLIHNNYKDKVSGIFDIVIWYTVSKYKPEEENDKIKELQVSIAHTLHLDVKDCPTLDMRKMKLSACLEKRRFLLILDDLWSPIDLNIVGVKFGHDKGSKILISSRRRDVIQRMVATDYSLGMEPLSQEDGWKLFSRKAFANGVVPGNDIETTAQEIARECKGLPLALNVVAAALSSERDVNKWRDALTFMRNVDPTFPDTHSTIDVELYQRLRWSFNDLSDTLKSCFLYCAAFPEDAEIEVETLVEMWSAEGLVISRGKSSLMDVGRQYIDALVSRCLIEYVGVSIILIDYSAAYRVCVDREVIKVHDVLRDMAIYIGEGNGDWVFASGQHLQQFPCGEATRNCKRLSVSHNDIEELPTDLECTDQLRCLVLAHNKKLTKVPAASFFNIVSLKVLDLSCTLITSLPISVGQLGQLEFLNFTGCYLLNELPESICSLSRLQFLNLNYCESLTSLPDKIADLKALRHFNFDVMDEHRTMVIPRHFFGLTSLTKLCLPTMRPRCAISMEELKNLSNLMELSIAIKPHTMSKCHCTWLKMRKLALRYVHDAPDDRVADTDVDKDYVVEDAAMVDLLPLENLNELRSLSLFLYPGITLPNYISKLPNLEELELRYCHELMELPVLEVGCEIASRSFPKLKMLRIVDCPLIKRLPIGTDKLCNLKEIQGDEDWWSALIWEDEDASLKLQPLFKRWW